MDSCLAAKRLLVTFASLFKVFSNLNCLFIFSVKSDWEDMDLGATPKGSRKMLVELNDTDSLEQVNYAYEDDYDTRDFDDLIFALKTGSQFEPTLGDEKDAGGHIDLGEENYEMKRISIADTHL